MEYRSFTYDQADFCLRTSLVYVAGKMSNLLDFSNSFKNMENICRTKTLFLQRKSAEYRWSNSDGLTKWLYDKLLSKIGVNPYKGLNHDQLRAYWAALYVKKDRRTAILHLLGVICRLGFTPSLMENALLKPQAYVLLLATIWEPLKYLVWPFFMATQWYELKYVPIEDSTTNKISLLLTMKLLDFDMPSDHYLEKVYDTYFRQPDRIGYYLKEYLTSN